MPQDARDGAAVEEDHHDGPDEEGEIPPEADPGPKSGQGEQEIDETGLNREGRKAGFLDGLDTEVGGADRDHAVIGERPAQKRGRNQGQGRA